MDEPKIWQIVFMDSDGTYSGSGLNGLRRAGPASSEDVATVAANSLEQSLSRALSRRREYVLIPTVMRIKDSFAKIEDKLRLLAYGSPMSQELPGPGNIAF